MVSFLSDCCNLRDQLLRQLFQDVLQNTCFSCRFCSIHGGAPVMESLFNKVAGLRPCKFIAEGLRRRCFVVGIVKFLRPVSFLWTSSGCFWIICISKVVFCEFQYFTFLYLTFDLNTHFLRYNKNLYINFLKVKPQAPPPPPFKV